MSDLNPTFTAPAESVEAPVDQSTADGDAAAQPTTEGVEALGDAGKKALDAMKADRNAARAERDALRAQIEGREAEYKAEREAEAAALKKFNDRVLRAELKAEAKGRVNEDMLLDLPSLMDLSAIEVGADGEVDREALAAALTDLITRKPSLAAAQGTRFQGGADGGARKESGADIDGQIAAATAAGQHLLAIQLKQQRAAQLANKS